MGRLTDLLAELARDLHERGPNAFYPEAQSTVMRPIRADYPNLLVFPGNRSGYPPQSAHQS